LRTKSTGCATHSPPSRAHAAPRTLRPSVPMPADQRAVGEIDLAIFVLAPFQPLLGEELLFRDIREKLLVRSVGKAKQVIQTLGLRSVLVREVLVVRHPHSRPVQLLCVPYLEVPRIGEGHADDGPALP